SSSNSLNRNRDLHCRRAVSADASSAKSGRPSAPIFGLDEPGLEIHRGCGEKSLRTHDHDFGNSRRRVRVVRLSGDSPPGEQSMKLRIITSVAAAAALALSLSACQKKADDTATSTTTATDSAAPAATGNDASATAPADNTAAGNTAAMTTTTPPATA